MALILKKSRLPYAGKGLFTTKDIKKGSKIIEYRGEIIDWKEYCKRTKEDKDGYMAYVNWKKCIDAYNTPQYKARYANDAEGLIRHKKYKNNAEYQIIDDKVFIVATRDIEAGEEIFVSYSKDYWDAVKYNIKNKLYGKEKLEQWQKIIKKLKIKL
jgi:SET domain-containing protein